MVISGLKLISPKKFGDNRGFFSETYNAQIWEKAGLIHKFVQDNESFSRDAGTIRGMHYQTPHFAQDKLVRVLQGRILDVAVDLRLSSPTFKQYYSVELSRENWKQLFIPIGFAHGFITLEPNTIVSYKVTNFYSPVHERGFVWNDPEIGIDWPYNKDEVILSKKDQELPLITASDYFFP